MLAVVPLFAGASTLEFDFGTDPGKVTPAAASFTEASTGSGSFVDLSDGLEVTVDSGSGFQNFAFLRSFDGLGGGLATDFAISTEIRINHLAGSGHENNDRWGILLFGVPGSDTADSNGIAAQVLAKANTSTGVSQTAQIVLRDGLNSTILSSADWVGGPIVQGDSLRLVVVGTYTDETQLALQFTLSRLNGSDSQSITTDITGSKLNGTLFGGALRIKNGRAIEYDTFSITADFPEETLPLVPDHLVVDGPDGLVYSPYANQDQTLVVHTVPDYSRVGYAGGGVPIPFVPAAVVLEPQEGDDTARIQSAINTVAALPLGPDGFRGAVLLKAGEYHVSSTLNINTSGIVIRGEGSQANGGTRITYTATSQSNLFHFHGSSNPSMVSSSGRDITDTLVPVGSRTLNISDATGYSVGDLVRVTNTVNQQWIDAIRMNADYVNPAWTPSGFQLRYYRYITAILGNQLTLDAPIMQAIEDQYGGGIVERATFNGAIRNVGIEAIRLESTFTADNDEQHGWVAVEMRRVVDGWMRQVTSRYFGRGLILIDDFSQFITVEDSACLDPKSITTGSRKYSFHVDDSSYVLMQRNLTRGGRHDYVTSSLTPGPNVFVDSLATSASNDIGPHFRYATGELYDNIKTNNEIRVQNRANSGTSHGWAGAQVMFWNVEAGGIVCDAPTGAMNWAVGVVGTKQEGAWVASDPFGIWESHNTPVQPRSLYYAQLRDRLGAAAVRRVILPQQASGRVWSELLTWDGDGLLGEAVLASVDTDDSVLAVSPAPLLGQVRDLQLMENLTAVAWTLISGPGGVSFTDATALTTSATFSTAGFYLLELSVTSSDRVETVRLLVPVVSADNDDVAPAAPDFLTASYSEGEVQLQWQGSPEPDVVSYNLYRSLIPNTSIFPMITALGSNGFTDADIAEGTRYYYSVTAVDADGNESTRSAEIFITAIDTGGQPGLTVGAMDGSWVRAGQGVQDASQSLLIKRHDFTGTARVSFLRYPLSAPATLGGLHVDDIESVSLAVYVTGNEPADTLRVYALLDGAQASSSHLTETSWTGGTDGTAVGGNNLQATNRPDGGGSLPNTYTTIELGVITFPGPAGGPINNALGLQTIQITNMEVFRQLLRNDTNGQITLLLQGQLDREFNSIASPFNTNGHLVPTLVLTAAVPEFFDENGNSIDDAWELATFDRLLEANEVMHESGVPYYFMYLHGTDPADPSDRFVLEALPDSGGELVFTWELMESFSLGVDYELWISVDLSDWDPLPEAHYSLEQFTDNGRIRTELRLIHDYGDRAFLRLVKP